LQYFSQIMPPVRAYLQDKKGIRPSVMPAILHVWHNPRYISQNHPPAGLKIPLADP
jgi:hypothetical protein